MRMSKLMASAALATAVVAGAVLMAFAPAANANTYSVTGLGLSAIFTTDASNNVISITGTVGTYAGDSYDPGAIAGPVSPSDIVFTGGGTNIFGMDGMLNPSAPYFGTGIGFTFVNPPVGVLGAALGLCSNLAYSNCSSTDMYELFMGVNGDRRGGLLITQTSEQQTSETPLPAALPLFASGLGALGLLGWRRKRKNAAITA